MIERQATYDFDKKCIVIQVVKFDDDSTYSQGRLAYLLYGFNVFPKKDSDKLFDSIVKNLKFPQ